jgi:hypothetical protein
MMADTTPTVFGRDATLSQVQAELLRLSNVRQEREEAVEVAKEALKLARQQENSMKKRYQTRVRQAKEKGIGKRTRTIKRKKHGRKAKKKASGSGSQAEESDRAESELSEGGMERRYQELRVIFGSAQGSSERERKEEAQPEDKEEQESEPEVKPAAQDSDVKMEKVAETAPNTAMGKDVKEEQF